MARGRGSRSHGRGVVVEADAANEEVENTSFELMAVGGVEDLVTSSLVAL